MDVEAMDVDMDTEKGKRGPSLRRMSPNSGKGSGHDRNRGYPNNFSPGDFKSGFGDMQPRRGRAPMRTWRTAYGWLHQQSGYIFLAVVFLAFVRAGLHASAIPSSYSSSSYAASPTSGSWSPGSGLAAKAKSWLLGAEAPHPIPLLMDAAETRFRAKVARQSTSLAAAVVEYKRRYARPPPAGFDLWYQFAMKHNFVMVDEFDAIHEDLAPFWNLSGAEVRERAALVGGLPSVDLVRVKDGKAVTVKGGGGRFVDSEVSARANGFKAMMGRFVKDLPDMDFPINAKAEGRVVVPWEHAQYNNISQDATSLLDPTTFRPDWAGSGSVWDAWRRTCPPTSPARRLYSSVNAGTAGAGGAGVGGGSVRDRLADAWRAGMMRMSGGAGGGGGARGWWGAFKLMSNESETKEGKEEGKQQGKEVQVEAVPGTGTGPEFAFVPAVGVAEVDFCARPARRYEQGHFFSDWRVLPVLVPIFSPARARGFGDIRVPSHYYYGGTKRYTYAWDPINLEQRAVDPMEVPWEQKRDVVWWRGASTGGGSSPSGFGRGYQRHRFLRMSSVGLVPGTAVDAQRTTAVTFAVPPQQLEVVSQGQGQEPYTYAPPHYAPTSTPSHSASTSASTSLLDSAAGLLEPGFIYTTVPVPLSKLNAEVMDAAFVKAVVPIGSEHRFGDSTELGVAWGYKYLLDLDGMGYSGRFMAFLASDSVPVKATVYDEFFSGWIEPWVHYIPLSATYSEIYNIVAYFSGPPPSAMRAVGLTPPPSTAKGAFRGSTYRAPGPVDETPEDETGMGMGADGAEVGVEEGVDEQVDGAAGGTDRDLKRPVGQVERRGAKAKRETARKQDRWKEDVVKQQQQEQQRMQMQMPVRSAAQEEGDRRLRRIARAGKQWKQTIGRTIDMEVYVYRLALEYARLWADDRDAMSYKG